MKGITGATSAAIFYAAVACSPAQAALTIAGPEYTLSYTGSTAAGQFDVSPFLNANGKSYRITSGTVNIRIGSAQFIPEITGGPTTSTYIGMYTTYDGLGQPVYLPEYDETSTFYYPIIPLTHVEH